MIDKIIIYGYVMFGERYAVYIFYDEFNDYCLLIFVECVIIAQ